MPNDRPRFPAHPMGEGLIGLSQRTPPNAVQAEQHLLGALLANARAYERVSDVLRPEHFADRVHGLIYAAIARRIEAGQVADVVTLRPEFEHSGLLDEAGGVGYLAELLSAMVGIINAGEYGRMIRDAWQRRQMIDACEETVNRCFGAEDGLDAPAILEALDARLAQMAETGGGAEVQSAARVAETAWQETLEAIERRGGLRGLTTGYRGLDRMTGGFLPGQLIVLGGRPAMGKSAIAAGIAFRVAAQLTVQAQVTGAKPGRVLFVSAEMDPASITHRAMAAVAQLPLSAATRGGVEAGEEWQPIVMGSPEQVRLTRASIQLGRLPMEWVWQAGATMAQIRGAARRVKRRHGLDLLVIDYLQLLRASSTAQRYGNKTQEVGELSQACKALAVELRVPVLLLSQLSRDVEKREDTRPQLSDLRDSGTIEQDADVVMFVHREHYYLKDRPPVRAAKQGEEEFEALTAEWQQRVADAEGRGEIIVRKQRQGRIGPVRMRWEPISAWFRDDSERVDGPAVPGLPE